MKQKFFKVCMYLLQVILTALASAGVALLQQYIESHGVKAGPEINPTDTGIIGSTLAGARIVYNNIKTKI